MKVEAQTKLTALQVESNLSPEDIRQAEISLSSCGIEGQKALMIMRKLSEAVQALEGSVKLFSLSLDTNRQEGLNCSLKFSLANGNDLGIKVSPDQRIRDVLSLSIILRKAFNRYGIDTIAHLLEKSPEDILEMAKVGQKSLSELRAKLGEIGYCLKGDKIPDAK